MQYEQIWQILALHKLALRVLICASAVGMLFFFREQRYTGAKIRLAGVIAVIGAMALWDWYQQLITHENASWAIGEWIIFSLLVFWLIDHVLPIPLLNKVHTGLSLQAHGSAILVGGSHSSYSRFIQYLKSLFGFKPKGIPRRRDCPGEHVAGYCDTGAWRVGRARQSAP